MVVPFLLNVKSAWAKLVVVVLVTRILVVPNMRMRIILIWVIHN